MKLVASQSEETPEEHEDNRPPYLLVAIKDDGNGAILEAHSAAIEFFRDGFEDDEFLETYCSNTPSEMGVYEWNGKVEGKRSYEGEWDNWLEGTWNLLWTKAK